MVSSLKNSENWTNLWVFSSGGTGAPPASADQSSPPSRCRRAVEERRPLERHEDRVTTTCDRAQPITAFSCPTRDWVVMWLYLHCWRCPDSSGSLRPSRSSQPWWGGAGNTPCTQGGTERWGAAPKHITGQTKLHLTDELKMRTCQASSPLCCWHFPAETSWTYWGKCSERLRPETQTETVWRRPGRHLLIHLWWCEKVTTLISFKHIIYSKRWISQTGPKL